MQPLDPQLISQIQRFYSNDLRLVRYAENIQTIHGDHITIGNYVYFTKRMDLTDQDDSSTLYHELQHTVQYKNRGGVEPFMTEYILKSAGSILHGGNSVDIHDNLDLERDADAKANVVSAAVPVALAQASLQQSQATRCIVGPRPNDWCPLNAPMAPQAYCECRGNSRMWYGTAQ
jgi:hypothetical protein